MAIYLGLPSPAASSNLPGSRRAALRFLFGLASDGVYRALPVTRQAVVSYTAFPPLLPESLPKPGTARGSGIFLLHFPWSRLHQTLSGILPCEARTFLSCGLSVSQQRPSCLTPKKFYHIIRDLSNRIFTPSLGVILRTLMTTDCRLSRVRPAAHTVP